MITEAIRRLRACRVCDCTPETAPDRDWVEESLCSACTESLKHVVSHTREYPADQPAISVATCQCGWQTKLPVGEWREMDRRVQQHWRAAVAAANGVINAPIARARATLGATTKLPKIVDAVAQAEHGPSGARQRRLREALSELRVLEAQIDVALMLTALEGEAPPVTRTGT